MTHDWQGEIHAIRAAGDRKGDGINIKYELLISISEAMFKSRNADPVMAAIRKMLTQCKAEGIDPLTLFH